MGKGGVGVKACGGILPGSCFASETGNPMGAAKLGRMRAQSRALPPAGLVIAGFPPVKWE